MNLNIFNKFKEAAALPLVGYKVTSLDRTKRYGIAASSLKMLTEKAAAKFQIKNGKLYLAADGTEVQDEEYFQTLPANTLFIVATRSDDIKSDFDLIYGTIRKNIDILETGNLIKSFVNDNRSQFIKYFIESKQKAAKVSKTEHTTNSDDPEWFQGQSVQLATKEKVMYRRSQDRIKGYFYKTKDQFVKSSVYRTNPVAREMLDTILEIFKQMLNGVDYFGTYFDRNCENRFVRSAAENSTDDVDGETPRKKLKANMKSIFEQSNLIQQLCVSLCNEGGDFRCQGQWNQTTCRYENEHFINPYASREDAILFQVWNLDHRIEISRTIIPSIIDNVTQLALATKSPSKSNKSKSLKCQTHMRSGKFISILTYFIELFTVENLKLVYIVCHDKGVHNLESAGHILCTECDEYKFLQKVLKSLGLQ